MNTVEIKKCLYKIHPSLHNNVYPANRLPIHIEVPTFIVSNLDSDNQPGSHWVAIHVGKNNIGQYFDSFGRAPTGFHRAFLNRNCRMWDYNSKKIQNDLTSVCGEYCLVYLYHIFHGQSMKNFVKIFDRDETLTNDAIVYDLFKSYF